MFSFRKLQLLPCAAILSASLLSACGGGGASDGNNNELPNESSINANNLDATVRAAIVGAETGLSDSVSFSVPFLSSADSTLVKQTIVNASKIESGVLYSAFRKTDIPLDCAFGGSQTITLDDALANASSIPDSGELSIQFDMCSDVDGVTTDGSLEMSWFGGWNESEGPRNMVLEFDVNYFVTGLEPFPLIGVIECSNFSQECLETSRTVVDEGVSYQVTERMSSGNEMDGYDVDATVLREGASEIFISGNDLLPCEAGGFSSGTIDVSDATNEVSVIIEFTSCNEARVTFSGESSTYSF